MVDSVGHISYSENIEDIIDARKKCGEYDVCLNRSNSITSQSISCRYAYSAPTTGMLEADSNVFMDDGTMWISEADFNNYPPDMNIFNLGPTDSEITVIRIKRESLHNKNVANNWDFHDEAIPGDGTHLGESPSLVNLVTLVGQSVQSLQSTCDGIEYLVPLSSWDPYDKPHAFPDIEDPYQNVDINENANRLQGLKNPLSLTHKPANLGIQTSVIITKEINKGELHIIKPPNSTQRRPGLAGRITNFLRKRCLKRAKPLLTDNVGTTDIGTKPSDVNLINGVENFIGKKEK